MTYSDHSPAQALKEHSLVGFSKDEKATTTSLIVAEVFGKKHKNVIRDIEELRKSKSIDRLNFEPISYKDSYGRKQKGYQLTRDAFFLIAMGFTGKKALEFKVKFLEAFNTMERELSTRMYGESMSLTELRKQVKPIEQKSFIYGHEKMYPLTQMRRAVGLYPNISGSERTRYQNLIFKWKGRLYCTEQYVLMKLRLRTAKKQRETALQHCKEIAQRKLEYTAQVHSLNLGI